MVQIRRRQVVLRIRKGQLPATFSVRHRVPTDMIDVQMRHHHIGDLIETRAGGLKP